MKAFHYRFGAYRLNPSVRELAKDGERIALAPRAFSCLLLLVEQRERALGRDELIAALWSHGAASDVQLGQLIVQCRRALDDDGQAQWAIRTVPGFGYHWVAPTEVDDDTSVAAAVVEAAVVPPTDESAVEHPAASQSPTRSLWRHARWGRAVGAALALGVIAALAWAALRYARSPVASLDRRVIVLPVSTSSTEESWLRLGGMDLIADRLRRSGLRVQPSEQTLSVLQQIDRKGGHAITDDVATLQAADPQTIIVQGRVEAHGSGWSASARADPPDAPTLRADATDPSPTGALRQVADRLAAALGHVPTPSVDPDGVAETLQRAQAATLANEPDAARAILLADGRLAHDEPRLRLQLAEVDIRAGRLDEARSSLDALLATHGSDPTFRARLLAARGTIAVRSGQYADAGRLFGDGIAAIGDAGDPQLIGRLHNGRAISHTSLEDYSLALLDYGVARDHFERAGDEGSIARVDGNIGAMELLRGHPAQAEPYLVTAIARFDSLGMVQERLGELQLLFVARRAQLKNTQAWEAMDASWSQHTRVPSPYSRLSMRLYRTEELLQQGRHNEAAQLLDDPANIGRPADVAENERIRLLRAELAWRRGHTDDALAELASVPEIALASADSDLIRADIELLRSRLQRSIGAIDTQADTAAIRPIEAIPVPDARSPLRQAAAANRAWAAGRTDEAGLAFGAAFALAQTRGVPLTLVRIADDYVQFLLEQHRVSDAAAIASQVALWAAEDYDAALIQLRMVRAQGRRDAWPGAFEAVRRLAGERVIPAELAAPPG
ncbi:MAG: winged helix-turn-helix domain-containing protein [Dokdonella sp.]|uniref:winged helix-turn-helix domain-containing protein n=1 Tax=Dokdonella sp. TaxID=2291710 RepID=UPI0032666027